MRGRAVEDAVGIGLGGSAYPGSHKQEDVGAVCGLLTASPAAIAVDADAIGNVRATSCTWNPAIRPCVAGRCCDPARVPASRCSRHCCRSGISAWDRSPSRGGGGDADRAGRCQQMRAASAHHVKRRTARRPDHLVLALRQQREQARICHQTIDDDQAFQRRPKSSPCGAHSGPASGDLRATVASAPRIRSRPGPQSRHLRTSITSTRSRAKSAIASRRLGVGRKTAHPPVRYDRCR
jgi:hypothetical protein